MIAHCAGPERYFSLLGLLFETQETWTRVDDPLELLRKIAARGGLGFDRSDICLRDQNLANAIEVRATQASKLGIDATPSLLINGRLAPGANLSYDNLDRALRQAGR
jgi:protein-disulfide isomerase